MDNEYCVVVSINGEVWGTWTLASEPSTIQVAQLHRVIKRAIKDSSFPHQQFHIDYIQNLKCDSFEEMLAEINESISNKFDQDID